LAGSNIIFDGYIYQLQGGMGLGGVSKMWAEIVPHMARATIKHGGVFTHCAYSYPIDLSPAKNANCRYALTGVSSLPGEKKVFFSSYYQGVSDVCFVHAVYDHIPERTGMSAGPHRCLALSCTLFCACRL